MAADSIDSFHHALDPVDLAICERLRDGIGRGLPEAEGRVWHAHPVWFLGRNPVVGYSRLKSCMRLMF